MQSALLAATTNVGKQRELAAVFAPLPIELKFPQDFFKPDEVPEVEETGFSYRENALLKANFFLEKTGLPTISDDSGLEVEALNGEPGIYSHRLALGSDENRTAVLLGRLHDVKNRRARFVSVVCLAIPGQDPHYFEGILPGTIITESRGEDGFGYDPVFVPDGYEQTLAELGPEIKNTMSHRGQALAKLIEYLAELKT